jgi:homoserine kinase type II
MPTYTELTKQEIRDLARLYDIRVKKFEAIERGNTNSNYYIRGRKRAEYVLTIAEGKTRNEITRLVDLLLHLRSNGFKTSEVVPSEDREYVVQFKGKPVFIKKWIEGKVDSDLSAKQLKRIGRALANLHTIKPLSYLYEEHGYGIEHFANMESLNHDEAYEFWLRKQHKRLEEELSRDLPRGIIHGDLFFDNVIFRRNKLQGIIDFDEACHYYLVFDLGMAIVGLCKNKKGDNINWRKAGILVKAYNGERRMEEAEREQLQIYVEYAATATSFWRYRQYHINQPSRDLMPKKWEMVDVARQVKRVAKNRFIRMMFE